MIDNFYRPARSFNMQNWYLFFIALNWDRAAIRFCVYMMTCRLSFEPDPCIFKKAMKHFVLSGLTFPILIKQPTRIFQSSHQELILGFRHSRPL